MSRILESEKEPEYVVEKAEDAAGDHEKLGTAYDRTDMHRLGKLQELRVSELEFRYGRFALTAIAAKIPLLFYDGICHASGRYLGVCSDVSKCCASAFSQTVD